MPAQDDCIRKPIREILGTTEKILTDKPMLMSAPLEPLTHAMAARAAEHIVNLRLRHRVLDGLPEAWRPRTMAEGYLIQSFAHRYLIAAGFGSIAGYKIGCTTAVMQEKLGVDHPCAGALFSAELREGRADLLCRDFHSPHVECEIAIRLRRDIDMAAMPVTAEAVADAVESCMAAIEIVDDRYEQPRRLGPAILTADDFYSAGCVLGEAVEDWRRLDLAALRGRIVVNGEVRGEGRGADSMGHPFNAAAWLATNLAARGEKLQSGQVVLTGSIVRSQAVGRGDQVTVAVDGLGEVYARYH
jgi:2-oxo-3-hexenedioate decarboxylase/2-keto-4-pentenoate hydratase